jgi:putative PEP-CTERM system TPR-repeat lipoprotein
MKSASTRTTAGLLLALAVAVIGPIGCGGEKPDGLIASAKDYLAKSDNKAATIQLRNVLQKNPDNAEARFLLGKALAAQFDAVSAEKEFRKALEFMHPAEEVVPELARALVAQGLFAKLVEEFGSTRLKAPAAQASLDASLGRARLGLGKPQDAEAAFKAALAANPSDPDAQLGEALLKATARDFDGAAAIIDKVATQSPGHIEARMFKADLAIAQGQPDEAIKALREIVQSHPDFLRARTSLVSLLLGQKRMDEAVQELEGMKKVAPQSPQTQYMRAVIAARKRDLPQAREAVQEVLKVAPDFLPAVLLAGTVEQELKSYAVAEAHLLKVLERVPQQPLARRMLVANYLRSGQERKALDTLQPLLKQSPEDSDILALAGQVYMANNDPDKASDYFEKAAALDPKNTAKRTGLALSHLAGGERERGFKELEATAAADPEQAQADVALVLANIRRGDLDKAMSAVEGLEKKRPNAPATHQLKATVYLAKNDKAAARKSFEKALELEPGYFPAAFNLARLDVQDKNVEAAKKRFESILAKDPKNPQVLTSLAQLLAETGGKREEIQVLLERAVSGNPGLVEARIALVNFHLATRDVKKATAVAQDAQAAIPENPQILETLGMAQQASGEINQAITTFNKVVALRPTAAGPLVRLASAQLADKDTASALRTLQKALAKQPDLLEAQQGIVGLELLAKRYAEAIKVAREVQKQRPNQAIGYVLEADVLIAQKKWDDAIAIVREGLKKGADSALATRLHGTLHQAGKAAEADKFEADWIKAQPKDLAFRQYLGERATRLKQYPVAIKHYEVILAEQPKSPVALNNLAWVLGRANDPKALEVAERAFTLSPLTPAIMDTYGSLLVEKGDVAKGLDLLKKAAELAPQSAEVRLNFARGLIKAGRKDEARRELEELAKLGERFVAREEVAALMKSL